VALVDDFTAWVTGPTTEGTREGIETVINDALDWEKRSSATFEAEKTAIIHFTRKDYNAGWEPFTIKGREVRPKSRVKILGVIMDAKPNYKEHIARAGSKGLEAAMELKRLRCSSPLMTCQLFTFAIAPVVDYASNVWMHEVKFRAEAEATSAPCRTGSGDVQSSSGQTRTLSLQGIRFEVPPCGWKKSLNDSTSHPSTRLRTP
jgi:hypothetical protein